MDISINVEGAFGLTWPRWQRLAQTIEQAGYAGIFCCDHFALPDPPNLDSLDVMMALAYVAAQSRRLHFGTLVAPVSFRDPVMLARQAMALAGLSGGRMILGVGGGWNEREHAMFGYVLGDVATRLDRFAEGLEVITQLIRRDEPVTFAGRFYRLQAAQLLPRPQPAVPVMVGGNGPKRTLPLVARYADIWNCALPSLETFQARSALLDELLVAEGRQPGDVKRTVMLNVLCWRTPGELEQRVERIRSTIPSFAGISSAGYLDFLRSTFAGITGSPEQVIEALRAYARAGAEEAMLQWYSFEDMEGLEMLAECVLPHVNA